MLTPDQEMSTLTLPPPSHKGWDRLLTALESPEPPRPLTQHQCRLVSGMALPDEAANDLAGDRYEVAERVTKQKRAKIVERNAFLAGPSSSAVSGETQLAHECAVIASEP